MPTSWLPAGRTRKEHVTETDLGFVTEARACQVESCITPLAVGLPASPWKQAEHLSQGSVHLCELAPAGGPPHTHIPAPSHSRLPPTPTPRTPASWWPITRIFPSKVCFIARRSWVCSPPRAPTQGEIRNPYRAANSVRRERRLGRTIKLYLQTRAKPGLISQWLSPLPLYLGGCALIRPDPYAAS